MTENEKKRDGNEKSPEDKPQLSSLRRAIYVGIVWALWLCSVYTLFFVVMFGALAPFAVAQLLYVFWIRKNKLAVVPYQRQIMAWIHTTLIYDIFYRSIEGNKSLMQYRVLGLGCLGVGMIPWAVVSTKPALDLEQMTVIRGTYESYKAMPGRRNFCGDAILTIRQEDGSLVRLWDGQRTKNRIKEFEQRTKDEILTIWGEPNIFPPECRKFLRVAQMEGKGYIGHPYDKKFREKVYRGFRDISIIVMACGGLCLLRVLCHYRSK